MERRWRVDGFGLAAWGLMGSKSSVAVSNAGGCGESCHLLDSEVCTGYLYTNSEAARQEKAGVRCGEGNANEHIREISE